MSKPEANGVFVNTNEGPAASSRRKLALVFNDAPRRYQTQPFVDKWDKRVHHHAVEGYGNPDPVDDVRE